ncbi:MAG: hypothetical protein JXB62_12760 [Pirellulales bacterium]|nr:hypothetical protein [Pirellulales bacterium]
METGTIRAAPPATQMRSSRNSSPALPENSFRFQRRYGKREVAGIAPLHSVGDSAFYVPQEGKHDPRDRPKV